MNLRKEPEILALAILLLLLAFVVPGDLNVARDNIKAPIIVETAELI